MQIVVGLRAPGGGAAMDNSISGLEIRATTSPDTFNVYLREHPIGTVVHSPARKADGGACWYIEHPREPGPLADADFFSDPSAAGVFLVRRLGLA